MADLSMVIPAYVTGTRIVPHLGDILYGFTHAGVDLELIVVDNGGDPSVSPMLEEAADVYLRYDENQGYPRAVNAGLCEATAPVAGVGSIDILLPPGWGRFMVDGSVCSALEGDEPEAKHRRQRGQFWGAWFTFPTEALGTVGFMDPEFAGWADRDYGLRLAQAGFPFARVPVSVGHVAPNHAHRELRKDHKYASEWDAATMLAIQRWSATSFAKAVQRFRPELADTTCPPPVLTAEF